MLNRMIKLLIVVSLFSISFTNGTIGLSDNGDGTYDVLYTSDTVISGFQFDVGPGTISGAAGGAAADNGFMQSSNGTMVIAFSLMGTTIPEGDGVLTVLTSADGPIEELSNIIFSTTGGNQLDFTFDPDAGGDDDDSGSDLSCSGSEDLCLTLDGSSLNYTSNADIYGLQFGHNGCATGISGGDAGSAGFALSCSGSTCIGFSFMGAFIDVANGTGTLVEIAGTCTQEDLSNPVFSTAGGVAMVAEFATGGDDNVCDDVDADGICDDVDDCIGEFDECGICNGDGIADGACDCDGNVTDCAGECGGSAVEDECGVCNGDGMWWFCCRR